ncbi:RseA family anti-sigma factor [Pseudomonas mangiferae]|uniref:RNA polymerase subunit sigma n=1 Tax=Pseudomonas mangiferae TaxID=2593654 RepID=A0A553H2E1_9PSED|nr:RseA family anti-sigma factor [Pseudomonas mangiferae]TRX75886.1 RNA polymerase subunit sigma [Pseudomonas mangiferae]
MNRETLQESLSAVMDNEADELELRRVLSASEGADVRADWARYQLARAAMHKDLLVPRLDIAAAVSAALADEAAPAKASTPWRGLGRLAVAASVTVAVLAGVRMFNQDDVAGAQLAQQTAQPASSSVAVPQAKGPAVLAGYTEETTLEETATNVEQDQSAWQDQRVPSYMQQHAQQAGDKGANAALPYARSNSMENR